MFKSEPLVAAEPPQGCHGGEYREDDGDDETPAPRLHAVDEVHTEERGNERREHDNHVERREQTHHTVHVVVDDIGIGVHRRVENVGVDVGGLTGLLHLDVHVLDEFGVKFIDR